MVTASPSALGRPPAQLFGGWEAGLLVMMALLYVAGAFINPKFFVSFDATQALLRDAARYAVMAVGMTFVIANKDLDLVGRIDLRSGRSCVRIHVRSQPLRPWRGTGRPRLPGAGNVHRTDQRHSRHGPARPGLHRDADRAAHRPRLRSRPDGWPIDSLPGKGRKLSLVLPARRIQRLGLQQSDRDRAHYRCGRSRGPRQDPLGLRDLRDRRQRAGGDLRRHPDAMGEGARLFAVVALRHGGRPDGDRAGQGRIPAERTERRTHRHCRRHHRRRLHPWRTRSRHREFHRCPAHRADQQGAARGPADHADRHDQRRSDAGAGGFLAAGGCGSRLYRPSSHRCRADRAA